MHYSNQSTLDHPDTLDIWVSVSSSPSPSVSPPPFFKFLLLSISVDPSFSQLPLFGKKKLAEISYNYFVACLHIESNSEHHMHSTVAASYKSVCYKFKVWIWLYWHCFAQVIQKFSFLYSKHKTHHVLLKINKISILLKIMFLQHTFQKFYYKIGPRFNMAVSHKHKWNLWNGGTNPPKECYNIWVRLFYSWSLTIFTPSSIWNFFASTLKWDCSRKYLRKFTSSK